MVDDQLELRSLHNRQVRRLDALEDASGIEAELTPCVRNIGSLCRQLRRDEIDPRQVAARPGEACDKTKPDRVVADSEDDRDRCGGGLRRGARAGIRVRQ